MRSGFVHHVDVTVADHQQVVVDALAVPPAASPMHTGPAAMAFRETVALRAAAAAKAAREQSLAVASASGYTDLSNPRRVGEFRPCHDRASLVGGKGP